MQRPKHAERKARVLYVGLPESHNAFEGRRTCSDMPECAQQGRCPQKTFGNHYNPPCWRRSLVGPSSQLRHRQGEELPLCMKSTRKASPDGTQGIFPAGDNAFGRSEDFGPCPGVTVPEHVDQRGGFRWPHLRYLIKQMMATSCLRWTSYTPKTRFVASVFDMGCRSVRGQSNICRHR